MDTITLADWIQIGILLVMAIAFALSNYKGIVNARVREAESKKDIEYWQKARVKIDEQQDEEINKLKDDLLEHKKETSTFKELTKEEFNKLDKSLLAINNSIKQLAKSQKNEKGNGK